MVALKLTLLLGCLAIYIEGAEHVRVQDWVTLGTKLQIVPTPSSGYVSPRGFLRHVPSGMTVRAEGTYNSDCPRRFHWLRVTNERNLDKFKFRFVHYEGHFGFLEHNCADTVVVPYGENQNPRDDVVLEMANNRNHAGHFYFDEESQRIVHRGGRHFWPNQGRTNPTEDARVLVNSNTNEASRYVFEGEDGSASPYPNPTLTGHWEILFAAINPINEYFYTIDYKVGKSITKQATEIVTWKVDSSMSLGWFKADSKFSYYACVSESVTWNVEVGRTLTVRVSPGKTVVTWQYIFESERFGEVMRFRSSIVGDTEDINTPPEFDASKYANTC